MKNVVHTHDQQKLTENGNRKGKTGYSKTERRAGLCNANLGAEIFTQLVIGIHHFTNVNFLVTLPNAIRSGHQLNDNLHFVALKTSSVTKWSTAPASPFLNFNLHPLGA
jgi:hypothetical protein